MGLLKLIGSAAGAAIGFIGSGGNPAAAISGAKIGGKIGGAVDGKGGNNSNTAQTQYIQQPKTISMDDIRGSGGSRAMEILSKRQQEVKVAKSADVPKIGKDGVLEDAWKPARDWWEDLGGEPDRFGPIDDTRFG